MILKKAYQHIFFDLDHTLWDFNKNSFEVLAELYAFHNLAEVVPFSREDLCKMFVMVNDELWSDFVRGTITKHQLRQERFKMVFLRLGACSSLVPASFTDDYLALCPTKSGVFPYTKEVLGYLHSHYQLHIITNGFEEIQAIKLASAGINHYFSNVVTSETTGYKKPQKEMFYYVLDKIQACVGECIMVGDSLDADILGAKNIGMDHVFFNPEGKPHQEKVQQEIQCLSKLMEIL
jgi:putative hydrolase of the HAD superfamily